MRKLRIGVVDIITKSPTRSAWAHIMIPNFASVMTQCLATWCQQEGHDVDLMTYTGLESMKELVPDTYDLVFIGAFSQAAQLAYALSNMLRSEGVVTVLGGPHARSYPRDAARYFDYVLGFTDREVVRDVLADCSHNGPNGVCLSAAGQPATLPGVKERWEFIEPTLEKARFVKIVNMIGSLGCPYTCEFCVDSVVNYQPLDFDTIKEDLRFLRTRFKRPRVGWHDPNFGVRFDDYLDLIEEAVPPGSIEFFAESSLSLLSEPHLRRLQRNGFVAILPGIESWFGLGNKARTGKKVGMEKVEQVADHINLVMSYVPYLQANFVYGTDMDEGPEPFECTKRFVDLAPGAYPAYCQLSSFGRSAPLNLEYQRGGRVLPVPFHFLNTQDAMNVKPKNYGWIEFYRRLSDLTVYTFSNRAIFRRYRANRTRIAGWTNVVRGLAAQGRGRVKLYGEIIQRLESDRQFRAFFEQETTEIPDYYIRKARRQLGPFWEWLPQDAMMHNHLAYLESEENANPPLIPLSSNASAARNGGNPSAGSESPTASTRSARTFFPR